MEVKPGYKQTEVGVIPAEWDVRRLDDLGNWKGGMTPSMQNLGYWRDGTVPWISSGDVKSVELTSTGYYITSEAVRRGTTTMLPAGSIVLVTRSGILRKYLPVATNVVPMAINQDIKALIPERGINSSFVLHALTECGPRILSACMKAGTTVESVEFKWLKAFVIPVPPLPEQRAIAAALSDVDALLGGLDRLIAKKRDLKQAAMQQLLTGQTRLPRFSGAWEVASLDTLTSRATGVWGSNVLDERNSRRAEIIRAGDISQDGRLTATATRYVSPEEFEKAKCGLDDLVITTSGNGLGKLWWCDGRSDIAASNFVRVLHPVPAKAVGRFLVYALRTDDGMRQLKEHTATSAYPNLRPTYFSTSWIPLPHPAEQTAIAAVLSDMDAELAALEARRDKTRDLKQAMMQELLTGRTRLL